MAGRHHRPEDSPPGRDKLWPAHSLEEMQAHTGALTNVDWMTRVGIQRDDDAGRALRPSPRRAPAPSREQGRYLDTSVTGRVIAILIVVGILVAVVGAMRGWW